MQGSESFDLALSKLTADEQRVVLQAVQESWRMPPMTRETVAGDEESFWAFLSRFPSIINVDTGQLDYSKVDKMMATGQIAYPMALKKAPISAIVRSPGGFEVQCSDERMGKLMLKNMQDVLPKSIEEILTFLEYGAYFSEVTYEIGWPQDYGLDRSTVPYWVIEDFNGCHPTTIQKILRDEKNRFRGFVQQPPTVPATPIQVGLERALIIPNNGLFGKLEGESVLGPVYVWWFWYELVWRAFLRFLQRQGVGVVVVKAPSHGRVEVNGKWVDNMQWALQMAASLHRTNYAALPSDADEESGQALWAIDYLKMGDNEGKQFIDALQLLSSNIMNYLLTGSKDKQEQPEFEVMLDTEQTLSHIATYINAYVLPKMLMWNGSSTRKAKLNFQGANSSVLPLIFKLLAVAGNTTGDALMNVDWRTLMSKGGVPILDDKLVEEMKQEKIEQQKEMFKQKQQPPWKQGAEKAKGPQGGEGRWASERDKEGKPEKMEALAESTAMIAEAFDIPLIALSADQVYELERLGLRADEGPIMLYNEKHDRLGRFARRSGAAIGHHHGKEYGAVGQAAAGAVSGGGKSPKYDAAHRVEREYSQSTFIGAVNDQDRSMLESMVRSLPHPRGTEATQFKFYSDQEQYAEEACTDQGPLCKLVINKATAISSGRTVSVAPKILDKTYLYRNTQGVPFIGDQYGEYIRNTLTHEIYHTRDRWNGKPLLLKEIEDYDLYNLVVEMEESSTDLIARGLVGGSAEKGADDDLYFPYMGAMAVMVAGLTDWDQEKGAALLEEIQFNMGNLDYMKQLFSDFTGTPVDEWDEGSMYAFWNALCEGTAKKTSKKAIGWLFGSDEE